MEITQSEQQKEKQIIKKWEQFNGPLRQHLAYQHSYYRDPRKRRETERGRKYIRWNYGWKLPELEEGKRDPGTGSTEGLKQDECK